MWRINEVVLCIVGIIFVSHAEERGQIYKECGDIYIKTCFDPFSVNSDPDSCGPPGMYCKDGYVKNETGNCILLKDCRCGPRERLITICKKDKKNNIRCDYSCKCPEGYEKINGSCLRKPCPEDCCTTLRQHEEGTTISYHKKSIIISSTTTNSTSTTTASPSTSTVAIKRKIVAPDPVKPIKISSTTEEISTTQPKLLYRTKIPITTSSTDTTENVITTEENLKKLPYRTRQTEITTEEIFTVKLPFRTRSTSELPSDTTTEEISTSSRSPYRTRTPTTTHTSEIIEENLTSPKSSYRTRRTTTTPKSDIIIKELDILTTTEAISVPKLRYRTKRPIKPSPSDAVVEEFSTSPKSPYRTRRTTTPTIIMEDQEDILTTTERISTRKLQHRTRKPSTQPTDTTTEKIFTSTKSPYRTRRPITTAINKKVPDDIVTTTEEMSTPKLRYRTRRPITESTVDKNIEEISTSTKSPYRTRRPITTPTSEDPNDILTTTEEINTPISRQRTKRPITQSTDDVNTDELFTSTKSPSRSRRPTTPTSDPVIEDTTEEINTPRLRYRTKPTTEPTSDTNTEEILTTSSQSPYRTKRTTTKPSDIIDENLTTTEKISTSQYRTRKPTTQSPRAKTIEDIREKSIILAINEETPNEDIPVLSAVKEHRESSTTENILTTSISYRTKNPTSPTTESYYDITSEPSTKKILYRKKTSTEPPFETTTKRLRSTTEKIPLTTKIPYRIPNRIRKITLPTTTEDCCSTTEDSYTKKISHRVKNLRDPKIPKSITEETSEDITTEDCETSTEPIYLTSTRQIYRIRRPYRPKIKSLKTTTPCPEFKTATKDLEYLKNCENKNMSMSELCDVMLRCCCQACKITPQLGHCPINEHYEERAPHCQETCQNTKCIVPCRGCVCDKGYIRDEISHACVKNCPLEGPNTHERFEYYGFERTCEYPRGKSPKNRKPGPGYYCIEGYLRNKSGYCVLPDGCN